MLEDKILLWMYVNLVKVAQLAVGCGEVTLVCGYWFLIHPFMNLFARIIC
jgi:hypothetical protein